MSRSTMVFCSGPLSFYEKTIQQRLSRSCSRPASVITGSDTLTSADRRSRSASKNTCRSRDRSKSRDIIELYTNPNSTATSRASTPCGRLPSYIYRPDERMSRPESKISRSQSVTPARFRSRSVEPRSTSEMRYSLRRDAISLCSNISTQSRALSNSEIATSNLELWMSTTSKNQRPVRHPSQKREENNKTVTLLEMDPVKNEEVELKLSHANSFRPANIQMMMIAGHTPSDDWNSADEIQVKPGAIITGLYKQNEWLFIARKDKKTGFVPFAYTKATRVSTIDKLDHDINTKSQQSKPHRVPSQSPIRKVPSGILKNSKNTFRVIKPSNNSADSESVSSASSNVFVEDPHTTRAQYADCLVVDIHHRVLRNGCQEDLVTYCSDSGISEPNSTHSDDNVGPTSKSKTKFHFSSDLTPSASLLTASALSNHSGNRAGLYQPAVQNPLGPLGARLQRGSLDGAPKTSHVPADRLLPGPLRSDTRDRAQYKSQVNSQLNIPRDYGGPRVRVIYAYDGDNKDDLHVKSGEIVTILNGDDVEWIWVLNRDGCEGFIPREYTQPISNHLGRCKPSAYRQLVVSL